MWNSRLSAIAIFLTLLFAPMGAQAISTSIDFGTDPVPTLMSDEYASQGLTISATEDGIDSTPSLKLSSVTGTPIAGAYLSAGEFDDGMRSILTLSFTEGIRVVSFDYAATDGSLVISPFFIDADAPYTLTSQSLEDYGSEMKWDHVTLTLAAPIMKLEIQELGFGQLIIDNYFQSTQPIPEPGAALLFGIGAIGTGLRLRGARRTSTRS